MQSSKIDTPLIHIGYHKTGTTWIQEELFTKASDVFFPLTIRKKGPNSLALHFIYDDNRQLLSPFEGVNKSLEEELQLILRDNAPLNDKIPVLSHERLSRNPFSGGFDSTAIASRIYDYFPDAKILIVIREQKSWLLSSYFQYLTIGGNQGISHYLNTQYDGKISGFSPAYVEYHKLIKHYQSLFGKEQVLVLPYEMLKDKRNKFIENISSFLKRDIDTSTLNFDKKYNSKQNCFIKYRFRLLNAFIRPSSVNGHFPYTNAPLKYITSKFRNLLVKLTPASLDKKVIADLEKEISGWAENRFELSNLQTQELTGLDLRKFGYALSK